MKITHLHPPISKPSLRFDDRIPGVPLINAAGVVTIAKAGETPQARRLYRMYCEEYRAREGQPMTHEHREGQAMLAACRRFGMNIVDAI